MSLGFTYGKDKLYDVGYAIRGRAKDYEDAKNWTLAEKCLEALAKKTNLTILLIGRPAPQHLAHRVDSIPDRLS